MTPTLPQSEPQQAIDPKTLIAQLKTPLKKLIEEDIDGDVEPEKIVQYRLARRNDLYVRGQQNIAPVWLGPGLADFSAVGTPISQPSTDVSRGQFDYVINIVYSDGLKATAVLGRAPSIRAVAMNPDSDTAEMAVKKANAAKDHLHYKWKLDERQKELIWKLWTYTTTFSHVDYVSDEAKYGTTDVPQVESKTVTISEDGFACNTCGETTSGTLDQPPMACPTCSSPLGPNAYKPAETVDVPQVTGSTPYANGTVELNLFSIFEVTTQFYAKSLADCDWLLCEYELPKWRLASLFPDLQGKINSDSNEGSTAAKQIGREARDIASSPSGMRYVRKNRWLYSRYWLRPGMYWKIKDDESGMFRQMLQQNFPNGVKVTIVDGQVVDLTGEKLDDHWAACKPSVSTYIFGDPLCAPLIPLQDMFNNVHNLAEETFMRGIPATIVSNELLDRKAMENRPPNPAEMIWARPGAGAQLKDQVVGLPRAEFSPGMLPWGEGIRETSRELTGTTRAIFGASGIQQQTAEEVRTNKNQAQMQFSLTYGNTAQFWCDTDANGVELLRLHGFGQVKSPSKEGLLGTQSQAFDVTEIPARDEIRFEADEKMPEHFSDQRDALRELAKNAPDLAAAVGLLHPFNIERLQAYVGIPGMYVPGANEKSKVRKIIRQLLIEQAVPSPPGIGPDGMPTPPGPPMPSIQPDEFDDHVMVAQLVAAWMIDDEGIAAQESNPTGFQNVVSFWRAHNLLAAPPPAPGGPPPPPPGAPGELPPPQVGAADQGPNGLQMPNVPPGLGAPMAA